MTTEFRSTFSLFQNRRCCSYANILDSFVRSVSCKKEKIGIFPISMRKDESSQSFFSVCESQGYKATQC